MTSLGPPSALGPEIIEFEIIPDAKLQTLKRKMEAPPPPPPPPKPVMVDVEMETEVEVPPPPPPPVPPILPSWAILTVGIISTLALVGGICGLCIYDWRRGYFPAPVDEEAIFLGLFEIRVPYPSRRDNAYDTRLDLYDLPANFRDWRRNDTMAQLGLDWEVDDIKSRCYPASLATLIILCVTIVIHILSFVPLAMPKRVVLLAISLFVTGLMYIGAVVVYILVLYYLGGDDVHTIQPTNPILASNSMYGVCPYLIGSVGSILCLLTLSLKFMLREGKPGEDDGGEGSDEDSEGEEGEENEEDEEGEEGGDYSPAS